MLPSTPYLFGRPPKAAVAAAAAFQIDGTPVAANNGGTTTLVLPALSSTNGNVVLIVQCLTNGGPVSSITSSGLTWARRASASIAASATEEWFATSVSALSSHVITITTTGNDFITASACAISGANFASPFDVNAAIPYKTTSAAQAALFTTTANDTMLLATYRFGSTGSPTAGTGFTAIGNPAVGFFLSEYKIVSGAQTASSATIGSGDLNQTAAIGDAVVKA